MGDTQKECGGKWDCCGGAEKKSSQKQLEHTYFETHQIISSDSQPYEMRIKPTTEVKSLLQTPQGKPPPVLFEYKSMRLKSFNDA